MELGLIGVNHHQMAIKDFEPYFLDNDGKSLFYTKITSHSPVKELVILTTCNRIEFYYTSKNNQEAINWILQQLSIQTKTDFTESKKIFKAYNSNQTIDHLLSVASGLNSMVFGENEILGQIKDTYDIALKKKKTGPYLNKCFQTAIATGKRARTETAISKGAYSVSSIAIDAIRKTHFDYFEKSICIIGAGTMGCRCLKKLDALGHPNITITNRSEQKLNDLKKMFNMTTESFETISENLQSFDIIISAVSIKSPIIIGSHFTKYSKPELIIDLGLPRNVDPSIQDEFNINIINVDGLKDIASKNILKREEEINQVKKIIKEEVKNFFIWKSYKQEKN